MKVVLYAVQPFEEPTGLCRYTATLASALRDRGVDIKIVLGAWQIPYYERVFGVYGDAVIKSQIKNTAISRYIFGVFDALKIFRTRRPDIVHFMSPNLISAFTASRSVVTVHDLYALTNPKSMRLANRAVNALNSAISISSARRIIAISNETKKHVVAYFPHVAGRVERIYQPVAAIFSESGAESASDHSLAAHRTPFVLSVAGHRAHKRLDLAMTSIAEAIARGQLPKETKFIVVGGRGTETEALERAADKLDFPVAFLKNIEDKTMIQLYRSCVALLITSESEGFCLPLAEATSLGVRAVCTDIPILREVGGEDTIFFELGASSGRVAMALETAASRPRPSPNGSKFNGKLYADRVLSVYRATSGSETP
jgi:hypothetical protein